MQSKDKQERSKENLAAICMYLLCSNIITNSSLARKVSDRIDADILEANSDGTKKAYERYKVFYIERNYTLHSEDTMLEFLLFCKEEKKYAPTSLWTIRSLVTSYLLHECKVQISDYRSTAWLKKINDIQKKNDLELFLTY
jgi:hypothetical protein